jgi:hypothetical protein
MRSIDNNIIIVYFSTAATISINMSVLSSTGARVATWVDPKTGEPDAAPMIENRDIQDFSTPEGWEDALLVITAVDTR